MNKTIKSNTKNKMSYNTQIGYNIKHFLELQHSDIVNLAAFLGYSEYDMNRLISGRLGFTPKMLLNISDYFNIELNDLVKKYPDEMYKDIINREYNYIDVDEFDGFYFALDSIDDCNDLVGTTISNNSVSIIEDCR